VSALDVIDSFVARSLQSLAVIARLRGAETVIVGIRPDIAIALVQFNLDLRPLKTAHDLDEARAVLERAEFRGSVDGE
jgi:rsbT antagonist protein RsbS